jgi:major membrane immunogen (membrane-anchored lipoprotein)
MRAHNTAAAAAALLALGGCADSADPLAGLELDGLADGTYAGAGEVDDLGATGEVTITIAGGDITDVRFQVRQEDGSLKDGEYGKVAGQEIAGIYDKAQKAVAAQAIYAQELERLDDPRLVDVVAGASVTHRSFLSAVADALRKAAR